MHDSRYGQDRLVCRRRRTGLPRSARPPGRVQGPLGHRLARHYEEHVGKGFYDDLVAFMESLTSPEFADLAAIEAELRQLLADLHAGADGAPLDDWFGVYMSIDEYDEEEEMDGMIGVVE